jgi:hypothetical protein
MVGLQKMRQNQDGARHCPSDYSLAQSAFIKRTLQVAVRCLFDHYFDLRIHVIDTLAKNITQSIRKQ